MDPLQDLRLIEELRREAEHAAATTIIVALNSRLAWEAYNFSGRWEWRLSIDGELLTELEAEQLGGSSAWN